MSSDVNNEMDEITENLYLGGYIGAKNIEKLKNLGIKKVLSIMNNRFPEYKENDNIIHKALTVYDFEKENIIKFFGECLNFIKGDDKVLVHCGAGSSRSATIVIAYITWTKKMSFKEALEFVKNKRQTVKPNPAFMDQLELFGKILVENNYDIDKIKFEEIKWEPKENNGNN